MSDETLDNGLSLGRAMDGFLNMTPEETTLMIRGMISQLPAAEREACEELADIMRSQIRVAGEPVGALAIALVGAEMQEAAEI